jgi:uncharacterized DUF497 family protein
MDELRFSWDPRKAKSNLRKHGVSFEEAETVFFDEHALLIDDPEASPTEDRFVVLGLSAKPRVLLVCHCLREDGQLIRIISARRPNKNEEREYWERVKR